MPARYLLDTNVSIDIQRARRPEVLARFQRLDAGEAMISAITYGELLAGAAKTKTPSRARDIIDEFANFVEVLPLSKETAQIYGDIRAGLELKGQVIGGNYMDRCTCEGIQSNSCHEQRARIQTCLGAENSELD